MASEGDASQLSGAERAIVDLAQQWVATPGMTVYLTGLQAGAMEINHDEGTLIRRTDTISHQLSNALLETGVIDARVHGRKAFDLIQALHQDRTAALNLADRPAANQQFLDDTDEPTPGTH